ncbi:PGAP1-domain-containing protein, partial [Rhizopus microsporus]
MTYIYPTYIRVEHQPKTTFSKKYTLYLYREGFIDSEELVGVPVLFIPGQAGSYKQVRSLASESSKYSHTQKNVQDLDWFTLDLNEELTAFSGQHVLDQANYANTAIQTILNLYHGRVDSVIIVGHSMGGIVARTLMMLPNYVPNSVRTILTLATPHTSAPVLLDPVIYRLYQDLSRFWGPSQFTKEGKLRNVTLVSIAGGSLDNIVHSDSTGVHSIVPESHGFAIFSTSIPFVWTESDHMAILWCNQLVKRLAATLVNIHDHAMSVHGRMDILKQHLLETKSSSLITHHYIPEESDHKWLLVSCKKVMDDWSCQPLNNASVTILPSASSPTGSYRYFTPSSSEPIEYVGILEQAKITLQDNNASFFIIYNDEATVHWSSTWGI